MSEARQLADDLADVNPADPKRFRDAKILPIFERMRATQPVHYCRQSPYGPFWSVTRYQDILAVDKNHQQFSSDAHFGGIMIDDAIVGDKDSDFFVQSFITMDPPEHGPQRKAVNKIVAPGSLMNFEKLIRERTRTLFDTLPINEEFDWVDRVSIELTTMMLATLFDFPFEDRRKLTRWSDVTTAEADSPIVGSQEQRIAELQECLAYFSRLKKERRNGPANFDLLTMLAQDAATADQPDYQFLGNLMLLIVGGNDPAVQELNEEALHLLEGDLRQRRRIDGVMEQAAAILLADPFQDAHVGFGADGDSRHGDLAFPAHVADQVDQGAFAAAGIAVAEEDQMFARRVGAVELAFAFLKGG